LLKADASEAGEGSSDGEIIEQLGTSASMVYRVRKQLVEEGFASVLPPYSPDLEPSLATPPSCARQSLWLAPPIEQVFAKFKHMMRKASERTFENTWRRTGALLDLFSLAECLNYLVNAGYASG